MRIGLNLVHAHRGIGGVWHYMENVLRCLECAPNEFEFVAFVNEVSHELVPATRFRVCQIPILSSQKIRRVLYEQIGFRRLADREGIDVMHWFANVGGRGLQDRSLVTIHDLLMFEENDSYGRIQRLYTQRFVRTAIREARLIAAVSQSTADAIQEKFRIDDDRLTVLRCPIADEFYSPVSDKTVEYFRQSYGLPTAFWVYVSAAYPHKNHAMLLEALSKKLAAQKDGWPLVLRGNFGEREAWLRDQIAERGLQSSVVLLRPLASAEMPLLYRAASGWVFPSRFEGQGVGVIEAMAARLPGLHSNIPTGRECAAPAIPLFDYDDSTALADLMNEFERDKTRRDSISSRIQGQVDQYRMDQVLPQILDAYRKVHTS